MKSNQKIIAFIASKDLQKAKQFYSDILELKFIAQEDYALVYNVSGTLLRISIVEDFTPHLFTSLGFIVDDIELEMEGLKKHGISFEKFPLVNEKKIWELSSGEKIAWFKDPDGNLLSLTQFPTKK